MLSMCLKEITENSLIKKEHTEVNQSAQPFRDRPSNEDAAQENNALSQIEGAQSNLEWTKRSGFSALTNINTLQLYTKINDWKETRNRYESRNR